MVDQYRRKINAPNYTTKVPESVQVTNSEKLNGYESELNATLAAIESFEKMKL